MIPRTNRRTRWPLLAATALAALAGCTPASDVDVYRAVIAEFSERIPFDTFCVIPNRTYGGESHDPEVLELFNDLGLELWDTDATPDHDTHLALFSAIQRDSLGIRVWAAVDDRSGGGAAGWLELDYALTCDGSCTIDSVLTSEGDGVVPGALLERIESREARRCPG